MSDAISALPVRTAALAESIVIMARLRAPDGCPWDREQTFDSIKRHTLEETYEVFDAIDRRAWPDLRDELGDLLLQVLFYAQIAEEAGHFTIEDVAATLNAKLIRRHPHVFAGEVAVSPDEVNANWEAIKRAENKEGGPVRKHVVDEVPTHMPALIEATKLGESAAKVGFDWASVDQVLLKLNEEAHELRQEIEHRGINGAAVEEELGDLLFTAVNLARHLRLEPEFALRRANRKFRSRLNKIASMMDGFGELGSATPDELDSIWRAAKLAISVSEAEPPAASGSRRDIPSLPQE